MAGVTVPQSNRFPSEFTTTHDTDGLAGWGALDWFRPAGTIIGSPVGGTIERLSGGSGGSGTVYGHSVYLRTDTGRRLFLTHFSETYVRPQQRIEAGEPLGRVAPYGNASHIHVATQGAADVGGKVNLGKSRDEILDDIAGNVARDIAGPGPTVRDVTQPLRKIDDLFSWITDPANLARIAQVGGGFVLLLVGLLLLGRRLGAELPGPAALR